MHTKKPPDDNLWSFRIAHEFLRTFREAESPSEDGTFRLAVIPSKLSLVNSDPKSSTPSSLGDFNRLYEYCGLPLDPSSSDSSARSDPTSDSTALDNDSDGLAHVDDFAIGVSKEVRWKDEVPGGLSLTELRRRSQNLSLAVDDSEKSDVEAPDTPTPASRRASRTTRRAMKHTLIPASILPQRADNSIDCPQFSPRPAAYLDQHHLILPRYTLTRAEQESKLKRKVQRLGGSFPGPIHVFMDCSNIIIGLVEKLKSDRDMKRSKFPPISYRNIAYILERGRKAARRILVGSHNTAYISGIQLPAYMREARKCGYELNILEQVVKPKVKPTLYAKARPRSLNNSRTEVFGSHFGC